MSSPAQDKIPLDPPFRSWDAVLEVAAVDNAVPLPPALWWREVTAACPCSSSS